MNLLSGSTRRVDKELTTDIEALNAEVVAISVDNLSGAEDIARQLGIPFPVLYDPSRVVTQLYEVDNPGDGGRARPATFVVNTEGVITWKYVGSGIGDRPSVSTILAQLAR